ncbi:nuclear transport factor 2 family protein [Homoserinibacter sp. YIM 151385]|uniref:nuclear transport factor 2 family protein n=1 Tax=Homoserinibacter sp. YIM 151385 TaxID=2985506 RepID=UPI0022F12A75|nr:nuclear transport factor 2 family protein [Homoserinibacter sp. YIM 151385]WBU37066.1 nuclear transport factor 2 family protein [Homoserinibacter sp. YIM 151385]
MTDTAATEPTSHEQLPAPAPLPALLETIDTYFRALHACDVDLLDAAFDPRASLFDADGGELLAEPYPEWREQVRSRRSPADAGQSRHDEVLLVDWLSPRIAVVKVRLRILDEVFVDHLSLVQGADGRFRIVAKTWHSQRRLPGAA